MPAPHTLEQDRRARSGRLGVADRGCRLVGVLFNRAFLLVLGAFLLSATKLGGQASAPRDEPNDSWTATTDLMNGNSLSTRIPVRITESHSQSGNRTLEERSVQIRGVDGRLVPYQEIEMSTTQVDSTTVRTTMRTFGRDVNGAKSLIQITEEEKHTLLDGQSNVQRVTYNPDVNGKLQPVQREMIETRRVGNDVEETNTTVMLPNINGGLAPALKTQELRKHRSDGTTEAQKTTLLADGAGKWELAERRQITTSQEGAKLTVEERVFRRDAEGKLGEVSRVLSEQSTNDPGEKRSLVETYSIDVPGTTRDGKLHLVERVSSSNKTDAIGGQSTEKIVEQTNSAEPGAGLRVSILTNERMVPGPMGEQSTLTIRARDSNGSLAVVSFNSTQSNRIPTIQVSQAPPEPLK